MNGDMVFGYGMLALGIAIVGLVILTVARLAIGALRRYKKRTASEYPVIHDAVGTDRIKQGAHNPAPVDDGLLTDALIVGGLIASMPDDSCYAGGDDAGGCDGGGD